MNDYRTSISSHVDNDDPRHWRFTRDSKLPRGYFDRPRISPDGWVLIVCCALGVAMLAVLIGERL